MKELMHRLRKLAHKLPLPRIIRENPFYSLLYVGLVVVGGFGIFLFALAQTLPSIEEIDSRQVAQSTKILDRTGQTSLYELNGGQRRTLVALSEVPDYLKNGTLAIENERFYDESAISYRGIARAIFVDIMHGEVVQGASTITQQLARNAFLTLEQTPTRKLKELLLAIRLNNHYTKDEIFELYLNEITYGPNIYGVQTASQAYFKKDVKDLTLAESAILAALPKGPSYYSPWGTHTKELFARQQLVLRKMNDLGMITDAQMTEAANTPITFQPQSFSIKAPHFVFEVQDYLINKYGEAMVQNGGLRVTTTLDTRLQEIAERVVLEGADRNTKLYKGTNAAFVAQDPKTGQVLAMVGSRDFFDREAEGNFNVATDGLRQPGSALKPFIYLAAFQKGYTPDTVLFDVPTEFVPNNPNCPAVPNYNKDDTRCFHPQDFDAFAGPVSIRAALAQSMNIPAVKTLYLVGIKQALTTLSDVGLTTLTDPRRYGLSLVLGGGEVHLSELVGAYGTLAAEGTRHTQSMILEVKDAKGNILESFQDQSTQVVDGQYARLVTNILSDIEARRPLYSASLGLTIFEGREVAMKTGTTNDYHDAWTFGYTPSLVAGVWTGNNDNKPMVRSGSSILAAVPIWSAFMKEALTTYPMEVFERPQPIAVEKPILRGDWKAQIHTILYSVDKSDPTGPAPLNPEDDPQFNNWEVTVQNWASANVPNYNANASSTTSGAVNVQITGPSSGSFVGSSGINLVGQITSPEGLSSIRVHVNGVLANEFPGTYAPNYQFSVNVAPQNLQPQNLVEVEGVTTTGQTGRSGVILFKL